MDAKEINECISALSFITDIRHTTHVCVSLYPPIIHTLHTHKGCCLCGIYGRMADSGEGAVPGTTVQVWVIIIGFIIAVTL